MKEGYSELCDWWSVGVIMFEMLVGYPPFCSETPQDTYRKIINWRHSLKFPEETHVSTEAKDLIHKLLCDSKERIGKNGVDDIKKHAFFGPKFDWDHVRERTAPIVPQLKSFVDTSYFDHFEEESDDEDDDGEGDVYFKRLTFQRRKKLLACIYLQEPSIETVGHRHHWSWHIEISTNVCRSTRAPCS
jgi:serine/threonine protein kinase